ncbi:hypothetical protein [Listeria booriae]|uniref:hypothetical protein n=1 Tax=Listeria booriae TaxID=1552123 RepID=UPI0016276CB5|nr:hypothetical protein [Listeria booriae]MBC1235502.1 hypothetical protein [Listeria booriae]MBC1248214.1 hypothetical protein [Listeria booriae]MBC1274334.1 hypothetical protein [Listeria booriae]
MKGTEKQVKWAKELRQQILESEEILFKCYEKHLFRSYRYQKESKKVSMIAT